MRRSWKNTAHYIIWCCFSALEWRGVKAETFVHHNLQEKPTSHVLKGTCLSMECDALSAPEQECSEKAPLWTPQLFYSPTKNLLKTTKLICCLYAHLCKG